MNSLDKTDQVIINLKVVSTLTEGERLCLRNNNFSIYSPGWAQAIYRWISGETRWVNMDDLKSVINDAIRILGTYINMVQHAYTPVSGPDRYAFAVPTPHTSIGFVTSMARELKAATVGLSNLRKTYAGDQLITATFDLLIERTLLEIQKAEETIESFYDAHGRHLKVSTDDKINCEAGVNDNGNTTPLRAATQLPLPVTQLPLPVTQLPLPVTQLPLPVTQLPLPATQPPLPVTQPPLPATQLPPSVIVTDVASRTSTTGMRASTDDQPRRPNINRPPRPMGSTATRTPMSLVSALYNDDESSRQAGGSKDD